MSESQIFLLIDLNAPFACKPHEWLEFDAIGRLFVPQAVYQEVQALASSRTDSTTAKIAREFRRFLLESDWQLTGEPFQAKTRKRAKLAIAVQTAAEELAHRSTGRLVVVISNDRALIQQVQALHLPNLTGIPVSTGLTWSRSKFKPPIVVEHLQEMRVHSMQGLGSRSQRSERGLRAAKPAIAPLPMVKQSWIDHVLPILMFIGMTALFWQFIHPVTWETLDRAHPSSSLEQP